MARTKLLICPYCGETQRESPRCITCAGLLEPLSRQATHNAMGPWFIRDESKPYHPGCSYETLVKLIDRGQVGKYSILRGPTTRQFWTIARHIPGVAHLLGYCHQCDEEVQPSDHGCPKCGALFGAWLERNHLGLPGICPLPGEPGEPGVVEGATAGNGNATSSPDPYQTWESTTEETGISSFASDTELVRHPETFSPVTDEPAGESILHHAAGEMESSGDDASVSESVVPAAPTLAVTDFTGGGPRKAESAGASGSGLVYALQRTIAQKQRTNRWLTGLLVAAGFGLASTTLTLIMQSSEGKEEIPVVVDQTSPPEKTDVHPPDGGELHVTESTIPPLPREEEKLPTPSPSEQGTDSSSDSLAKITDLHERLLESLAEGENSDLSSVQRLKALRDAETLWLEWSALSENNEEKEEIGKRIREGIEREEFFAPPV